MSGGRWDQSGVPHKGWDCVDVVDLRADGGPADETDYATCQMCGNEKIRYVHVMAHPDLAENLEVGCVCAEKMSNDYEGPRRREAKLRNRAVRRTRWLQRKWRVSATYTQLGRHSLEASERTMSFGHSRRPGRRPGGARNSEPDTWSCVVAARPNTF